MITLLALLALCELGSRLFWTLNNKGARFFSRDTVLHAIYPELGKQSLKKPRRHDDRYFDILLLGGSALTDSWTEIYSDLKRALGGAVGREYRIHNVARSGHTSRDSLNKYRVLAPHQFDLVIIYHGINEARANCCPPDTYREDYSHMDWYAEANPVVKHRPINRYFTLPDTLLHLGVKLRGKINPKAYMPAQGVDPDYLSYGSDIRSKVSFRDNLREIIKLANGRGDPVALLTFATYVPPNYSREGFETKSLDYAYDGAHVPIELWGSPDNVQAAVRAHNEVTRELNREAHPAFFVDMEKLMPKQGADFNDICHLSGAGSARFVTLLVDALGLLDGTAVGG